MDNAEKAAAHLDAVEQHFSEDSNRLAAVRLRLGDRFDLLSSKEKLGIPLMSSTELAKFLAEFERIFPARDTTHSTRSSDKDSRDEEVQRVHEELKLKYKIKDIEEECAREHDEKKRSRKIDELRRLLALQAQVIADIEANETMSDIERKEARRTAEATFMRQLDEFRKGQ